MAESIRIQRLSSLLRRRIAEVLEHELSDPRSRFVTITRIKLASDLSTCIAFYSVMGSEGQRSAVARMLENASGYVQRESARALKTRTTPRLSFQFDPSIIASIELGSKIDEALREDRARRGEDGADLTAEAEGEEALGDGADDHDEYEDDEEVDDSDDDDDADSDFEDSDDDEIDPEDDEAPSS